MATGNFYTMREFDNYACDTGDDADICPFDWEDWQDAIADANTRLKFYTIELKSGYYASCQLLVKETWDGCDSGRGIGLEKSRINRTLAKLADAIGFRKFERVAQFSNGETMYKWADAQGVAV